MSYMYVRVCLYEYICMYVYIKAISFILLLLCVLKPVFKHYLPVTGPKFEWLFG
jgi:hypothetical protein